VNRVPVKVRVRIADGWRVGDKLQIYTDWGSGTIDTDRPLLPQAMEIFPGQIKPEGMGTGAMGRGSISGKPSPPYHGGLGHTPLGVGPLGGSEPYAIVTVYVPDACATWKFAAEAVDEAGNPQGDALEEMEALVSGEEPPPLLAFAFSAYDDVNDKAKFSFTTAGT